MTTVLESARRIIAREPLVVRAVLAAAADCLIGWGLPIDPALKASLIATVSGAILAWARQKVTPA